MDEIIRVVRIPRCHIDERDCQLTINVSSQIRSRITVQIRHDHRHATPAADLVSQILEGAVAVSQQYLKSATREDARGHEVNLSITIEVCDFQIGRRVIQVHLSVWRLESSISVP